MTLFKREAAAAKEAERRKILDVLVKKTMIRNIYTTFANIPSQKGSHEKLFLR